MRITILTLCLFFSTCIQAKEWKSLKSYEKASQNKALQSSDWLSLDRRQNTVTWQNANLYNLNNSLPQEYINVKQRRDFYKWFDIQIKQKGHEVIWPSMAYYISQKLRLAKAFPFSLFARKQVKNYASQGGEIVFNKSFKDLKELFFSNTILKDEFAVEWDKNILYNEQYVWIDCIYKTMDSKSLKQIERIAKGKLLYGLALPKAIRFEGNIANANDRYVFAIEKLRVYCKAL